MVILFDYLSGTITTGRPEVPILKLFGSHIEASAKEPSYSNLKEPEHIVATR